MSGNEKLTEEEQALELTRQLDEVLEVIKKIEDNVGLFRLEDLFTALHDGDVFVKAEGFARSKSFVDSEMTRRFKILMRDGSIYAPRPGLYKRTAWADERCTWTCPEPGCGGRCGGVRGHPNEHQCPTHHRAVRWRALDKHVLVVAKQGGHAKEWTCYIGAVPGNKHEEEWQHVAAHGSSIEYKLAKMLFPSFARSYRYVT